MKANPNCKPTPGSGRPSWIYYLLLGLLLLTFINFSQYALRMIYYPYEWDPYEAYHVYQSWRFINGDGLYTDISAYPMHVLNYTPLFFIICGAIMKLSGLGFWPGRMLATTGALAVGGLIYLAIRSDNKSPFWAVSGALLFFASPRCAGYFMPMIRVDTVVLALSLAGLYATYRASSSTFYSALALLLYLLAFYTKPTAIIPVAAGLVWLFTVDSRRALLMGVILLVSGTFIFAYINYLTDGEFYHHVVGLNLVRREPGLMLRLGSTFVKNWMIFFIAALAGFFGIVYRKENTIWAYFFAFSLIGIPMSSRHGAVLNYYLPITAAVAIICGREAGRLDGLLARMKHPLVGRLGFLFVGITGLLAANVRQYAAPNAYDTALMNGYRWAFGKLEGEVLFSQMHSLAFMNGKAVFIFPMTLETTCGPAYEGVEQSRLLNDLREQRIEYVVDTYPYTFFSPRINDALNRYYEPAVKIAMPNWRGREKHLLWTPRGKKNPVAKSGPGRVRESLLNVLAGQGMADGVVRYYRELLEMEPDNANFHYNLGVALQSQGKNRKAVFHLAEACRLKPDYAAAHLNLGNVLRKEGRSEESIAHYQEALKINPGYAKAHHNLGVILSERGQVQAAREHLEAALSLQSDFNGARKLMERLEEYDQ